MISSGSQWICSLLRVKLATGTLSHSQPQGFPKAAGTVTGPALRISWLVECYCMTPAQPGWRKSGWAARQWTHHFTSQWGGCFKKGVPCIVIPGYLKQFSLCDLQISTVYSFGSASINAVSCFWQPQMLLLQVEPCHFDKSHVLAKEKALVLVDAWYGLLLVSSWLIMVLLEHGSSTIIKSNNLVPFWWLINVDHGEWSRQFSISNYEGFAILHFFLQTI